MSKIRHNGFFLCTAVIYATANFATAPAHEIKPLRELKVSLVIMWVASSVFRFFLEMFFSKIFVASHFGMMLTFVDMYNYSI